MGTILFRIVDLADGVLGALAVLRAPVEVELAELEGAREAAPGDLSGTDDELLRTGKKKGKATSAKTAGLLNGGVLRRPKTLKVWVLLVCAMLSV